MGSAADRRTQHDFARWVLAVLGMTVMTSVALLSLCAVLPLLPIKAVHPTSFRRLTTLLLALTVPGFLCVPFSWCGTRLSGNGMQLLDRHRDRDLLVLSNHGARIDWVVGLFFGVLHGQRVGFITEAFILILPVVGWFRYLMEDMFVFRSFKRDSARLERNIFNFQGSNAPRWIFLCPEGMIVDFSAHDMAYVKDCRRFCQDQGFKPFEYLLTPRYKGMQCFNKISRKQPAEHITVTMAYTLNGETLTRPLLAKDRVVPDLTLMLKGGLDVHVDVEYISLSQDGPQLKKELMQDYERKDGLLRAFHKRGRFPNAPEGPPEYIKTPHLMLNASLAGQMIFTLAAARAAGALDALGAVFTVLLVAISASMALGQLLAQGQTRESVPFEGLLKALLFRYEGRE